jgi:hypothetical protein
VSGAEFTPGPWSSMADDEGNRAIVAGPAGLLVTFAFPVGPATDANAYLIAASPDLYEALGALAEACEHEHLRRIAHAALAKAEGRQS